MIEKADDCRVKEIEVILETGPGAETAELRLPAALFNRMMESTGASFKLTTEICSLSVNAAAAKSIGMIGESGNIVFTVSKKDPPMFTDRCKTSDGKCFMYEFTVTSGGKNITSLDRGTILASVPTMPAAGDDPGRIAVYSLTESGELTAVKNGEQDSFNNRVVFPIRQFSAYFVGY